MSHEIVSVIVALGVAIVSCVIGIALVRLFRAILLVCGIKKKGEGGVGKK